MTKFRIVSRIEVADECFVFDSIEEAKAYVAANPPGVDAAIDVIHDVWNVDMSYVVEEVTDNGFARSVLTIADGESWDEAEVELVDEPQL